MKGGKVEGRKIKWRKGKYGGSRENKVKEGKLRWRKAREGKVE